MLSCCGVMQDERVHGRLAAEADQNARTIKVGSVQWKQGSRVQGIGLKQSYDLSLKGSGLA